MESILLLPSPRWGEGRRESAAAAGSLACGGRDFAGLRELLEAAQVLLDLARGVGSEQPRQPAAKLAPRRVILEHDTDLGAPVARRRREVDRASGRHLRALQR